MPGNLLTLPIGDTFMYVQPVYTRRAGESNFPILRFVLVSYEGNVGIGETLRGAIADSLIFADDGGRDQNADSGDEPSPTEEPTPGEGASPSPSEPQSGTVQAQIRELLRRAETKFVQADQAQADGETVRWARLMEQGRALIEKAVELAD